ncbi:MAG: hypothetical protein ACK56F_09175, partial [bacterium]
GEVLLNIRQHARQKDWRPGAAAHESLRRDRSGGLTSTALLARGSASLFRACTRSALETFVE